MLFTIWIVFHVIVCIGLILVVLMQSSKGEGLAGSAFGGGGGGGMSGAVFGGRGAASFLSKSTTVLAVVFMINCAGLAFLSAGTRTSFSASSNTTPAESVVTREAQKERDQALQFQQQQQQAADTSGGNPLDIQVVPNEAATQTKDTSGN